MTTALLVLVALIVVLFVRQGGATMDVLDKLYELSKKNWFWWVIVIVPLLVLYVYLQWTIYQDGNKLASLQTKLDQLDQSKKDNAALAKAAAEENKIKQLKVQADALKVEYDKQELRLKEGKVALEERKKAIDRIDSIGELLGQWGPRSGDPRGPADK